MVRDLKFFERAFKRVDRRSTLVVNFRWYRIGLSWLQTPREDRAASSPGNQNNHTPTPSPSPVGDAPAGRALMEAALQQATSGSQPPLVVTPPGYWVDGTDHRHALDSAGRALLPAQPAWQPRIDQDDTAKCYRRFFVGRVRRLYFSLYIQLWLVDLSNVTRLCSSFDLFVFLTRESDWSRICQIDANVAASFFKFRKIPESAWLVNQCSLTCNPVYQRSNCHGRFEFCKILKSACSVNRYSLTTCHVHVENLLSQNCNIFSVPSIYSSETKWAKQIINLSLLNNFYPVTSYTDEFEKKATNYCIRGFVTRYGPQLLYTRSNVSPSLMR